MSFTISVIVVKKRCRPVYLNTTHYFTNSDLSTLTVPKIYKGWICPGYYMVLLGTIQMNGRQFFLLLFCLYAFVRWMHLVWLLRRSWLSCLAFSCIIIRGSLEGPPPESREDGMQKVEQCCDISHHHSSNVFLVDLEIIINYSKFLVNNGYIGQ